MHKHIASIVVLFIASILISIVPTFAQETGNLLSDPSFEHEGEYKVIQSADDAVFAVPPAWSAWVTLTPRQETWQNLNPNGYPHTGLFKIDGARSLSISRGYATFTTAVFQTVTVPENANLVGSARGFMQRGSPPVDGAQFRVGIDPSGGTNPLDPGIIWSPWVTAEDGWQRARVDATAIGTSATLFLYSTQSQPSDPNSMYWDDAVLRVGGEGGSSDTPGSTAVPVVPTPAFADFVSAQPANPDGSITHTVQAGDTLDAIAVAYSMTRDELLALNPALGSGRFLVVGQTLVIREAPPPTEEPEPTADTSSTDQDTTATESSEVTTESTTAPTEVIEEPTDEPTQEPTEVVDEPTEEPTETAEEPTEVPTETKEPTIEPTEAVEETVDEVTAEPTEEPTATEVPPTVPPTDAPPAPVTEVAQAQVDDVTALCVWMFDDVNQNRIQEADEALLSGGNIVVNSGSDVVETYVTDASSDPFCFEDFAVGNYTVVAAAPDGYGLTTAQELSVRVQSSTKVDAKFGAAEGFEQVTVPPVVNDDNQQSTDVVVEEVTDEDAVANLLQISGLVLFALAGLVIVAGVGLAVILRAR